MRGGRAVDWGTEMVDVGERCLDPARNDSGGGNDGRSSESELLGSLGQAGDTVGNGVATAGDDGTA